MKDKKLHENTGAEDLKQEAVTAEAVLDPDDKTEDTRSTAELMLALDDKNQQLDEIGNRLLRLQADFDNFRRRSRQEKEEASQIIANSVITRLLPVLDNFERALAAGECQNSEQLLAGMELVYRQFLQILEGFGVTVVCSVGEQFDPNQHEAVMRVEDDGQPDGLVVEEMQKGYMACGKLLRPCMVKVVSNC